MALISATNYICHSGHYGVLLKGIHGYGLKGKHVYG
jgi:hypothetical protein